MLGLGLGLGFNSLLAPTFSPDQISQLKVWLKGDAGVTLVGGEVDVWADQSGNFNNVSAPAAINRPTTSTQNGKNVLVFNGNNKVLQNTLTELLRNLDAATIIVAGSCSNTTGSRHQVNIGTPTLTSRVAVGYRPNNSTKLGAASLGRRLNTDPASVEVGQTTLSTSWLNNMAVFNWSGATLTTYVNNVQTDTLNPFQTAGLTPNDGGALTIGSNSLLTAAWFIGNIGEILVYQKELSSTERANINTYLNNRWIP